MKEPMDGFYSKELIALLEHLLNGIYSLRCLRNRPSVRSHKHNYLVSQMKKLRPKEMKEKVKTGA